MLMMIIVIKISFRSTQQNWFCVVKDLAKHKFLILIRGSGIIFQRIILSDTTKQKLLKAQVMIAGSGSLYRKVILPIFF
jgi:hypothetical protein